MKKSIVLILAMILPFFAFAGEDPITDQNTTPLKVLCRAQGYVPKIMVQFVRDNQAVPGVYVVQNDQFWPANKITRVSFELYGESMSKVGQLDNGGRVRLFMSVDGRDLMGKLEGSNATFGDDATLYNCIDLRLK